MLRARVVIDGICIVWLATFQNNSLPNGFLILDALAVQRVCSVMILQIFMSERDPAEITFGSGLRTWDYAQLGHGGAVISNP